MIQDPMHSRPIDVHRWSDHPEVKALVEDLWEGYLPEEITGKVGGNGRTGRKSKYSKLSVPQCALLSANLTEQAYVPLFTTVSQLTPGT